MELRHIRYFLAVAQEQNFTRAAQKIGIGQPPLSLQIRDLEREVGTRLFHRIPQGAELTAAGQAFHDLVRNIPAQVERATHAAQRAARGELGALRIGFTASASFNPVVATAIRNFRRAFPDVDLTLEESNTLRLMAGLKEGDLDAVFIRPGMAESGHLTMRVLSEESLLAVLPKDHAAASQKKLNLKDLSKDPFILYPREVGPTLFDIIIAACRDSGFEPILGQSAPQLASVVHLVAAELGVSLVPASMQQVHAAGVVFKEIDDISAIARLTLAWRRSDNSAFLQNFINCAVHQ